MSCDAVSALFLMFTASGPVPDAPARLIHIAELTVPAAPGSVAGEPMFADIIARASGLNSRVTALREAVKASPGGGLPGYSNFKSEIAALAVADQAGSDELRKRGGDSDLKCILHGIYQDLPKRLSELEAAATPGDKDKALREMSYLLRDNVEVITAPPAPPV
ncbi:MAG: hypothetical protein WCI21_05150 [Alphaproteobacteria bacterium]